MVSEYLKQHIVKRKPRGWSKTRGANAPIGYEWCNNGESRFSGKRRIALVKTKEK